MIKEAIDCVNDEGIKTISKDDLQSGIENFIKGKRYDEKAEKTLKQYTRVLNDFSKWLPNEEIITKEIIIDYKHYLKDCKFKTVSINNKITIVNAYLKKMEREKMCVDLVKMQKKHTLDDILDEIDYKRLLKWAKKTGRNDMEMMMRALSGTGARIAELKFFTVEAIYESSYINVSNKAKERNLILTNELRRTLKKYCKDNHIKEGYIFKGKVDPCKAASEATIWRDLQKIAGLAKVNKKKVHAHSFRHLFSLRWIANGGSVTQLADILGHSSIATTQIYTRTTREELKKTLENMR